MSSTPVLSIADSSLPFGVRTDASNFAIGGTLYQILADGSERIIAYYGRKMTTAELNYDVRETELLAIIHELRIWRPYLLDKPFRCETDHQALTSLLSKPTCSRRLAHWLNELAEYPLEIHWIPGKINTTADGLSRHPDFEAANPKASVVMLKDFLKSIIANTESSYIHMEAHRLYAHSVAADTGAKNKQSALNIHDLCAKHQKDDEYLRKIINSLKEGHDPKNQTTFNRPRFELINDVLYFTGNPTWKRLCVPRLTWILEKVMYKCHDTPTIGHVGANKTKYNIRRKFFWKGMDIDIDKYVNTCEICQRIKHRNHAPFGLLNPLDIPKARKTCISMDFITGLPITKSGTDSIWVIVDRLTKRNCLIPCLKTDTAEQHATRFFNEYVRYHGLPLDITSDRDSTFTAQFWQALMRILGIDSDGSIPFHMAYIP